MPSARLLKSTTVLPVSDIYDTAAWYERVLGLATLYVHGHGRRGEAEDFANYAILARDDVEVHFILDEAGPVWTRAGTGYLYLRVSDVDGLYPHVTALPGVRLVRALQRESWPARAFVIADPSGNEIRLEQPD